MSIPSRMGDRILVLSKLKQTNYSTLLTDINLQGGKRVQPAAPVFGQPDVKRWSSRGLAMSANYYATVVQEVERDLQDALSFPLDTWLAAWVAAFGMGSITSSQPNPSNAACYQHVIKPFDPNASGKDLPVTTVYTEAANVTGLARRLQSCCIKDFSFDFPASAPGSVSANIIGSGQLTTGILATPPALLPYNLLMSNDMTVKYGLQGAPVDISSEIVPGSVKFGFTWNMDDKNSRGLGGGLYRMRAWAGAPDISLSFQRFVDDAASTPMDDFLADTIREVLITVPGAVIGTGPERHQLIIRGLAVVPTTVKLGQSGDMSIYEYSFNPDHWLKQGAADVVTITVQNLETSYFA